MRCLLASRADREEELATSIPFSLRVHDDRFSNYGRVVALI